MATSSLNSDIDKLNSLFLKHGEKRWKINRVSSGSEARNLINSFGGMGSLNDIYICKINGHKIEKSEEAKVNEQIRSLLSSIHDKCVSLITK